MASEGFLYIMTKDYSRTEVLVSTTQLSLHKLQHAYKYDKPSIYALIPVDNWVDAQQFIAAKFDQKFKKTYSFHNDIYTVPNLEEALEYFYACCVEYQTK